jgi:hypothetical protein
VFRNEEIPARIAALKPFLSDGRLPDGTRRWSGHSGPAVTMGHLPARLYESARSAVYVVYSYDTPIAWVTESPDPHSREPYLYHIPDVGYSPTTGQHQYACLDAWRDHARQGTVNRHGRREVVRVPGNAEVYGRTIRARSGGMDGARPGEVIGRVSAYADTGDDAAHMGPTGRAWRSFAREATGYRHPAHP